jgi:hypothetical protein
MLRWGSKKKRRSSLLEGEREGARPAPHAETGPEPADEWAFLRDQPDHDADEMAAVHGVKTLEPEPAEKTEEEPAWPPPRLEPKPWKPKTRKLGPRDRSASGGAGIRASVPLPLKIEYAGDVFDHTLHAKALIGRTDEGLGLFPELDFSEDDAVSRLHARIYTVGGCWVVQDLNSMNGTTHNGKPLEPEQPAPLRPGDVLEVGLTVRIRVAEVPGWSPDQTMAREPAAEDDGDEQLTAEDHAIQSLLAEAGGAGYLPEEQREQVVSRGERSRETAPDDLLELALSHAQVAGWVSTEQAKRAGSWPEVAGSCRDAYEER